MSLDVSLSLIGGKKLSSIQPPATKVGRAGFSSSKGLGDSQMLKTPLLKPNFSILEIVGTLSSVRIIIFYLLILIFHPTNASYFSNLDLNKASNSLTLEEKTSIKILSQIKNSSLKSILTSKSFIKAVLHSSEELIPIDIPIPISNNFVPENVLDQFLTLRFTSCKTYPQNLSKP